MLSGVLGGMYHEDMDTQFAKAAEVFERRGLRIGEVHHAQRHWSEANLYLVNHDQRLARSLNGHELGVGVPQELSVIGFDDIPLAAFMTPPLSTVRVPQTELAALVFRALISELDGWRGEDNGPGENVLNRFWVPRRSTAQASGGCGG
jgi:DNA-binding LacI/PurR family transcriptional regulator